MTPKGKRRRKPKGSRTVNSTILIVCQGKVTEPEYFKRFKSHYALPSLSIIHESDGSPEKIVKSSMRSGSRDKNAPFAKVFFVVDVDDSSEQQFQKGFKDARNCSTKDSTFSFIVSNEAFDAWLLAHFEDIKGKDVSRKAVANALKARGVLVGSSGKSIAMDFPIGNHEHACKQVQNLEPNTVGRSTSTAMPYLIDQLLSLKNSDRPHGRK